MEYSAESIRFLHLCYALLITGQIAYVLWMAVRWSRLKREGTRRNAQR